MLVDEYHGQGIILAIGGVEVSPVIAIPFLSSLGSTRQDILVSDRSAIVI